MLLNSSYVICSKKLSSCLTSSFPHCRELSWCCTYSWKLPLVIHKLNGYDGHLIATALKSEFGMIPQNMEKYLWVWLWVDWNSSTLPNSLLGMMSSGTWGNLAPLGLIRPKDVYPYDNMDSFLTDLTRRNCLSRMHSLANCLQSLFGLGVYTRNSSIPFGVRQWRLTTTSTCSWVCCFWQNFLKTFAPPG